MFSIPKLFRGHAGTIQTNAIQSWTLLRPTCEIILFGDEDGTAETAARFGVRHVPEVTRNEFGTPLLNSSFKNAQEIACSRLLCYVNADVILLSDFMAAVERVRRWSFLFLNRSFLMVGRRWNVDIDRAWDFGTDDWQTRVRDHVMRSGSLYSTSAIDYFVFTRGLWGSIPPFAIGRPGWDNWMIYRARFLGAPVINATSAVMAVHQNHDYSHNTSGKTGIFEGPEARRNRALSGGSKHFFSIVDATWSLTPRWLRPAWGKVSRQRKRQTEAILSEERFEARRSGRSNGKMVDHDYVIPDKG